MKQGMRVGLPFMVALSLLSGCVTERMYTGTDVAVKERSFDKKSAANERLQLGLIYLQRGNAAQAKFNLDKAVSYAPELESVHMGMAYYYQHVGDNIRSEQSYKKAISRHDATGDALNNFGVFLCQQKKYQQAERMFLKAIDMPKYTQLASSYENLGICSHDAKQLTKAKHYFEMALKYDSRRVSTIKELLLLAIAQKDYAYAKTILTRYQQLTGESAQSLLLNINIDNKLQHSVAVNKLSKHLLATYPASEEAKHYRAE